MNITTPASLGYPLSVFNKNSTLTFMNLAESWCFTIQESKREKGGRKKETQFKGEGRKGGGEGGEQFLTDPWQTHWGF